MQVDAGEVELSEEALDLELASSTMDAAAAAAAKGFIASHFRQFAGVKRKATTPAEEPNASQALAQVKAEYDAVIAKADGSAGSSGVPAAASPAPGPTVIAPPVPAVAAAAQVPVPGQ